MYTNNERLFFVVYRDVLQTEIRELFLKRAGTWQAGGATAAKIRRSSSCGRLPTRQIFRELFREAWWYRCRRLRARVWGPFCGKTSLLTSVLFGPWFGWRCTVQGGGKKNCTNNWCNFFHRPLAMPITPISFCVCLLSPVEKLPWPSCSLSSRSAGFTFAAVNHLLRCILLLPLHIFIVLQERFYLVRPNKGWWTLPPLFGHGHLRKLVQKFSVCKTSCLKCLVFPGDDVFLLFRARTEAKDAQAILTRGGGGGHWDSEPGPEFRVRKATIAPYADLSMSLPISAKGSDSSARW